MGAFSVTLFPVLLATLPPFLEPEGRTMVMNGFAPFCHQIPSRSPHVMGVQLAVGHCTYGILLGLPLGSFAFLLFRRWERLLAHHLPSVLAIAALPMAIDWALGAFDLWGNTPTSRVLTGGFFGLAAAYYVTRGVVPTESCSKVAPSS